MLKEILVKVHQPKLQVFVFAFVPRHFVAWQKSKLVVMVFASQHDFPIHGQRVRQAQAVVVSPSIIASLEPWFVQALNLFLKLISLRIPLPRI